ncbi:xanthine dehydrogenase family protein molybdopterin-binding subunit (plasmid) [Thioclava sp. 'Guangxiensis']|uniref:xanthine dehydrogenase family protein molybdopterin-binding subunit n=1 Tax=Thioclava sp. 'Guangxiensis' TaxID=3149044 RepID=UPI0032C49187
MNDVFRMDKAQPRLLDEMQQGVLGKPLDRSEGALKVSGLATYAAEVKLPGRVDGVLVRATITKGKVTGIDESSIAHLPGILGVFHGPKFLRNPAQGMADEAPSQPDTRVDYYGQPVALVVAESFEQARDGALNLKISYEAEEVSVDPLDEACHAPDNDGAVIKGEIDKVMTAADVAVDLTFTTAGHVAAAMEPHAAVAEWKGEHVILHGSLQMLRFNRNELADSLGIDPKYVRVLSPYVGGGFGSKLGVGAEAVAACLAAKELGRPVRVVMTRQNVFDAVLHRTQTVQRLRFAADKSGKLLAIGHDDLVTNLSDEGFAEPCSQASQFLYGAETLHFLQTVAQVHRTPTGSVRAPGEAVGMVPFEAAFDELAEKLDMDPVELRLKNIPDADPVDGLAYSARSLAESLREGAKQFGWDKRQAPRSRMEGEWYIGMGVASAARKNLLVPSAARVILRGDGAVVETDMTDIGTGSYTILGQIAAEMLGLPMEKVEVRLGDTDLPGASGSGGSFGANSAGSAVFLAAKKLREEVAGKLGCDVADLTLKDGIARGGNLEKPLSELIESEISAEGAIEGGKTSEEFLSSGFGAHFVEVAVHRWTGETRVRRMLGVFGMGRILNEKTARSQAVGGMIWGVGTALNEELSHDPRTGHLVSRDLANYHVPSHADIPGKMDVVFLEERDDQANPIQTKGIGELGISGAGAAILNAIHNACGVRVYDVPATPDKIVAGLEALEG